MGVSIFACSFPFGTVRSPHVVDAKPDAKKGVRSRLLEEKKSRREAALQDGLMCVYQAYKYEIRERSPGQFQLLARHAGLSRFAKNWSLRFWVKEREEFERAREHIKLLKLDGSAEAGIAEIQKVLDEAVRSYWSSAIHESWTKEARDVVDEIVASAPFAIVLNLEQQQEKREKIAKAKAKEAAKKAKEAAKRSASSRRSVGRLRSAALPEKEKEEDKPLEIVEHRRTPLGLLSRLWTQTVKQVCVSREDGSFWAAGLTRWAAQGALIATDGAYFTHFKARAKANRGELSRDAVPGLPTFKKRNGKKSFAVQYSGVKLPHDDASLRPDEVKVQGVGVVRLYEGLQKFQGTIKAVSVSSEVRGRWWISFTVERTRPIPRRRPQPRVGVDLGARDTITLSDGVAHERSWEAPKPLANSLKRLRRLSRAQSRRRKPSWDKETHETLVEGSSGWYKARLEVAKLNFKIACQRRNWLHNVTTEIAKTYTDIVIEGYNARELVKKSRKVVKTKEGRRNMADSAVGMARWMLKYKGDWYGCHVTVADSKLPANKTCSVCGWVSQRTQSKRIYKCDACGQQCIRPINTARFLARFRPGEEGPAMESGPKLGGEDKLAPSETADVMPPP
jgi:putative transposase